MPSTRSKLTREQWNRENTSCMFPGCKATHYNGYIIDTHEIIGGSDRKLTMTKPAFWLRLCRFHHDELGSRPNRESLIMQLAWKKFSDEENYNGVAVVRLWRPKFVPELVTEILRAVDIEWRKIAKEFAK